jgi:Kef-type K+ transport system membrane component KefB
VGIIGRWAAIRFDQPAVLGELLIGVILGNVAYWLGSPLSFFIMHLSDAGQIFDRIWLTGGTAFDAAKYIFPASELEPGGMGQRLVQIMTGPGANKFIIMGFSLWLFSNLGVILLLFMVGLESSVKEMLEVAQRQLRLQLSGRLPIHSWTDSEHVASSELRKPRTPILGSYLLRDERWDNRQGIQRPE